MDIYPTTGQQERLNSSYQLKARYIALSSLTMVVSVVNKIDFISRLTISTATTNFVEWTNLIFARNGEDKSINM